ncbi:MAG: FeoB-associated Cys-rich membrane protein [Treponema sp.]|nr:FeoB-associated Cys-rich membrane protein [Treponema sp.]
MNFIDLLILAFIILICGLIIIRIRKNKKKGKCSCGCDCCSNSSFCKDKK